MPCIQSAHDMTSLYPVGIATIETKWSVWREGQQEIAGSSDGGSRQSIDRESSQYIHYSVSLPYKIVNTLEQVRFLTCTVEYMYTSFCSIINSEEKTVEKNWSRQDSNWCIYLTFHRA